MTEIKIAAKLVKELRDKTGASIMECKKALAEAKGNLEKATEYLRKHGKEKAAKKSDRTTAEGIVATYIHSNQKIGVILELLCETDFVAKNSEFQELAHDLAMHIAAANPKYLSVSLIEKKELKDFEKFTRDELASEKSAQGRSASGGKPAAILEKIVSGKIKKHFDEIALLSQPFIKNPDMTVDDLIKEKIAKIGENIQIGNFVRFEI